MTPPGYFLRWIILEYARKSSGELRSLEPNQGQDQARPALPATLRVVQCCVTLSSGRIGCSLRTRISMAIQVFAKTDIQTVFVRH